MTNINEQQVLSHYAKMEDKEEMMAKFLGGKYRATIRIEGKAKRGTVFVDISELEVRKSLGYRYEFSFASDFNTLMKVANKIQLLGYGILVENDVIKVIKRTSEGVTTISQTISGVKNGGVNQLTYFATFYKFIVWYFDKTNKK